MEAMEKGRVMEETILKIAQNINTYLSDYILIFLLVGVGLWFTIRTKFVQIRFFGHGLKQVFGGINLFGKKHNKGMSSFQALSTAIAAQVGTGNIVGASGAILVGGPGAIFWMWVIAFFGMATIYSEAVLAIETREESDEGYYNGGPVYYIRRAFKGGFGKFLSVFFAVAITLALGFFGCMVQSNSIGESINTAFGIPTWVVGVVLVVLCGIIFFGGVKRLAAVTEKIVPIMAVLFIIGSLIVIFSRINYIPATFKLIFSSAFNPTAVIGGSLGMAIKTAISQGAKRGLFSNEAGMGSTPHAHAQANVKSAHDQGSAAMIGVFIDTFVVLTLNALVIISTLYTEGGRLYNATTTSSFLEVVHVSKTNLAQLAFGEVFGAKFGSIFVAVCLFFFAFSTILSWNLFGKINANFLFKVKGKKTTTNIYTCIALVFIFLGTLVQNDLVWELTDVFNNIMVIPNVIGLVALTGIVIASVKKATDNKNIAKQS